MRSQHTLPVRGARFRCGHEKSLDNVTYRRKHPTEPYAPVCRTCDKANSVAGQARRMAKRTRRPVQWITAPRFPAILAECRAQLEAAMAQQARKVGRPKKQANIQTGEAA